MNGPAWLLVACIALVVAAYLVVAVQLRRVRPPARPRVALLVDVGATAIGVGAIVVVLLVARPGEQPRLGAALGVVLVLLGSPTADRWRTVRQARRELAPPDVEAASRHER